MATLGSAATSKTLSIMTAASAGLAAAVAAIAASESVELAPIEPGHLKAQQVAADVAEKTAGVSYPAVYIYCAGLNNVLKEKFRTFSGKAQMAVEVRVTHDRLERVYDHLQYYVAAAIAVLDANRGDWGSGMFYTGGYKVEFGPVKHGGKNFLQVGKVLFDVDASY
jgi:prephenate dehydrogenase